MSDRKTLQEGAEVPKMQQVPLTKGAEIPSMQAVEPNGGIPLGQTIPSMQPIATETTPAATSNNGSTTSKTAE